MKYTAYFSDAYYVQKKIATHSTFPEVFVWAHEWPEPNDFMRVGKATFDTIEEAREYLKKEAEGSKWAMYSAVFIEDENGSEVYSDVPSLFKCECCGHEKWDRVEVET